MFILLCLVHSKYAKTQQEIPSVGLNLLEFFCVLYTKSFSSIFIKSFKYHVYKIQMGNIKFDALAVTCF